MPAYFDSGMMVRTPSWHGLENVVLEDWPGSWAEAVEHSKIDAMGPVTNEVLREGPRTPTLSAILDPAAGRTYETIEGWQELRRADTGAHLSVQPKSYAVIRNDQLGQVVEQILDVGAGDDPVKYETLISLYGGKQIIALVRFDTPLDLPDASATYLYLALWSRHDGQGGLRGIPTNIRVVCANTAKAAEIRGDRDKVGFTIRHTKNWEAKIEDARLYLAAARKDGDLWVDLARKLSAWKVGPRQRETFLKRFMPVSDDMQPRQHENTLLNRDAVRRILESKTCEGISDNGYGLAMAATEWSDHDRPHRSQGTYVTRQLLSTEPNKVRAFRVIKQMAAL